MRICRLIRSYNSICFTLLYCLILVLSSLLDSTKTSSTAGTDKTNLSSCWSLTATGGWLTNVLMVTSSVGMLYGVLSYTTNLGPAVTLDGVLVVGVSSLEKGLIGTSTSGNNTNLGTDTGRNGLLSSRGKTKTGGSLILIVGYYNSECSRSTSEGTTVTNLSLNVAHDGSLRYRGERKDVSYGKSSLLSAVNVLSRVHTLSGDHKLIVPLEAVGIEELNLGHRSTTTRIVKDLLYNSLDVSVLLGVINGTKLYSSLASAGVCLEDGGLTLPLCLFVRLKCIIP